MFPQVKSVEDISGNSRGNLVVIAVSSCITTRLGKFEIEKIILIETRSLCHIRVAVDQI